MRKRIEWISTAERMASCGVGSLHGSAKKWEALSAAAQYGKFHSGEDRVEGIAT